MRAGPSANVVVTNDSAVGEAIAPPIPCSTRAANRKPELGANPPARLARENTRMPVMNILRRPKMSPARPPSSRRPPNASVYAFRTQARLVSLKCSAVLMCGSAMFTIVASSTIINWALAMTSRARPG